SQADLENSINSTLYCYNTKLVWSKAAIAMGTRKHYNIHDKKDTLRESLLDKTNIGSRSSSKDRSKPSKSFNFGFEPKHIDKENISQTDLLQEILERLNRLEISRSE
ncbi:6253_t:CDS:2, partial [Gigaspora rosea]